MICSYCQTQQIAPFELDSASLGLKSVAYKHVKLKHNKTIHVVHINERRSEVVEEPTGRVMTIRQDDATGAAVLSGVGEFSMATLTSMSPPSPEPPPTSTTTETTETTAEPNQSQATVQTMQPTSTNKILNLNDFSSLTQLVDSSVLFKNSKKHGLNYLDGSNLSFYYRNKLKLGESHIPVFCSFFKSPKSVDRISLRILNKSIQNS